MKYSNYPRYNVFITRKELISMSREQIEDRFSLAQLIKRIDNEGSRDNENKQDQD